MIVELAIFAQLAASCVPTAAVETLAAIARTESGFDDAAIHDNTTGRTYKPASTAEAIATATELVVVDRHSVDLGLMQVNSANLPGLGLSITDAFDACHNLAAGARVLAAAYVPPAGGEDTQPALHQALSRYNTGDPVKGVANGYVAKVQASAELVVPAIRLRGDAPVQAPASGSSAPIDVQSLPPPPASWDVYGQAKAGRSQGVVVFGNARPLPAPVPAAPAPSPAAPTGPVQLRGSNQQAMNDAR